MDRIITALIILIFITGCSSVEDPDHNNLGDDPSVINNPVQPSTSTPFSTQATILAIPEKTIEPFEMTEGELLYSTSPNDKILLLKFPTRINTVLYSTGESIMNSPKFFPDGEKIAFLWDIHNEHGVFDLYVGDIYSSEPMLLVQNVGPYDISPDGEKIAFIRETSNDNSSEFDIFLFDLETEVSHQITHDGSFKSLVRWSPTGDRMVFISVVDNSEGDLYIIDRDGTRLEKLLEGTGVFYDLSWESNSGLIAVPFLNDELIDLKMIDSSSKEMFDIVTPDGICVYPLFVPNKNQIIVDCVVSGSWNIYLLDIPSGEFLQLTQFDNAPNEYTTIGLCQNFMEGFVVFSYWEGSPTETVNDLYLVSLDGERLLQLTEGLDIISFDWFSKD